MDVLGIERRRLGTGLLVFGLIGVVLAGIMGVALIGGAFAARDLDEQLKADQDRIAAALTRLTVSMDSLAITAEHAGETLQVSSDTLGGAQDTLGSVAATAVSMSQALDVSILGSKPFASAVDKLQELARQVTSFQQQAGALAQALHTNSTDVSGLAAQVRQLKESAADLAALVGNFERIDRIVNLLLGGIVLGGLLTLWIAVAAGLCAWTGLRLRRAPAVSAG